MANHDGKRVPMTQPTPIIGQRFLEVDIPAGVRKIPEGAPLPLAGLFHGDKSQLDRIEEKLDQLLELFDLLNSDESLPLSGKLAELKPAPKLET